MSVSRKITLVTASLLLTILATTPATAQGGYGPGSSPSGPPGGGPPGGRGEPPFDLLALEGPLSPADFTKVTGATTGQEAEYGTLYDAYQKATRATRDSAQLAQLNIRAALDHGRREALPPLFATLNSTGKTLDTQLKAFDEQVKKFLPKDQRKKYEKDEKERRKALEEEQKEMLPPRGGPGGPGGQERP